MDRYLILDTETSSLFTFKKDGKPVPADDPGQPRLAEAAMLLVDENLKITHRYVAYVKPDGWEMEAGATAVNGLTTDHLLEVGVPIGEVLDHYEDFIKSNRIVVTHNAQHDTKQMRGELRRAGRDDLFLITRNICTMRGLAKTCDLRQKNGKGLKWPSLSEACRHFGIPHETRHSAEADAVAVLELLRNMRRLDIVPEARVHFAKGRDDV